MLAIQPEFLNGTVFLCVEEEIEGVTRRVPKSTGFFVGTNLDSESYVTYVVTARHCIEEARTYGTLYVRVNRRSGAFVEFPTRPDDWLTHDSADVALIPFAPNRSETPDLDYNYLRTDSFVGPGPTYEFIGPVRSIGNPHWIPSTGEGIFFVGLFTEHYGTERNPPIARFGNIARMPTALRLPTAGGGVFETVGYLAEFHSWGGHSGSPVFALRETMLLEYTDSNDARSLSRVTAGNIVCFLGLLSGHYEISQRATVKGDILGSVQTALNSGIAIITPADAIMQLLSREDVAEARGELKKRLDAGRPLPVLDSAPPADAGFTQAAFEQALRQVSRRVKPSEPDA